MNEKKLLVRLLTSNEYVAVRASNLIDLLNRSKQKLSIESNCIVRLVQLSNSTRVDEEADFADLKVEEKLVLLKDQESLGAENKEPIAEASWIEGKRKNPNEAQEDSSQKRSKKEILWTEKFIPNDVKILSHKEFLKQKEGLIFDFVDREDAVLQLYKHISSNFNSFKKRSRIHQSWILLGLFGQSGIGKTRLSFEVQDLLYHFLSTRVDQSADDQLLLSIMKPDYKYTCDVFVKMTNGEQYREDKDRPISEQVEEYLAMSIVSRLYLKLENVNELLKALRASGNGITAQGVLSKVRETLAMDPSKILTVFLRIDEFQFLLKQGELDVFYTNKDAKRHTTLYQFASKVMEIVVQAANINVFIVPIFSGTLSITQLSLFPNTLYSVQTIPLVSLSLENAKKIMANEIELRKLSGCSLLRPNNIHYFDQLLQMLGPIPRLLSHLCDLLQAHQDVSVPEVYNQMKSSISGRVVEPSSLTMLKTILYRVFSKTPWNFETESEIGVLVDQGSLTSNDTRTLSIPFIFLDLFCSRYWGEFPFIEHFRDLSKEALPGDIETFVPQFYCFKQELYLANGVTSTTVGQFFRGAYMTDELSRTKLLLGDIPFEFFYSLHETLQDVSHVPLRCIGSDKKINLNKTSGALWIGKKFAESDCFLIFPEVLVKTEVKSVVDQSKHIAFSGASNDTFQHEQAKALDGSTKLKNRTTYFLFVTNAIMTEKNAVTVVDSRSMFINQQRWNVAFSDAFWFLQSRVYNKE